MIHPDLRVHDLHPEGTAHLQGLFGSRQWNRREIQVLHASGRVVNALDTASGILEDFAERIDDPQAEADRLLEKTGAGRVIIVDADLLDGFASSLPEIAKKNPGQAELLWAANEAFWNHPAVVTSPAPVTPEWPRVAQRLQVVGERFTVVVAIYKEGEPYCDFMATVEQGLLTEVTSSLGMRPWWKSHDDLIAAVEERGPVPIAVACEQSALDDLFASPDAVSALANLPNHPAVHFTRGFELLFEEDRR
ncbi:MAG TPA: hypothetical protein VND22_06315 [Actinomycetota bacterium]|nr:hypothetical protein [Actinomycetota bacterium]